MSDNEQQQAAQTGQAGGAGLTMAQTPVSPILTVRNGEPVKLDQIGQAPAKVHSFPTAKAPAAEAKQAPEPPPKAADGGIHEPTQDALPPAEQKAAERAEAPAKQSHGAKHGNGHGHPAGKHRRSLAEEISDARHHHAGKAEIMAEQRKLGIHADGIRGKATIKAEKHALHRLKAGHGADHHQHGHDHKHGEQPVKLHGRHGHKVMAVQHAVNGKPAEVAPEFHPGSPGEAPNPLAQGLDTAGRTVKGVVMGGVGGAVATGENIVNGVGGLVNTIGDSVSNFTSKVKQGFNSGFGG